MSDAGSAAEAPAVLHELLTLVYSDAAWRDAVEDVLDPHSGARGHLAVMHEPYLSLILTGRKTIESRFSQTQVAPYRQVRPGDLVLFKLLAGPVTAIALVADADFYVLDPEVWRQLRERFEVPLAGQGETFWEDRRHARYATLIRLGSVLPVSPLPVAKRDRRGWVVLGRRGSGIHRDQLGLPGAADCAAPTNARKARPRPASDQGDSQMELGLE